MLSSLPKCVGLQISSCMILEKTLHAKMEQGIHLEPEYKTGLRETELRLQRQTSGSNWAELDEVGYVEHKVQSELPQLRLQIKPGYLRKNIEKCQGRVRQPGTRFDYYAPSHTIVRQ